MKLFYFIIIFIFFLGCSFDDKSGIWKNINETTNENSIFNQFETLSSSKVPFKETVNLDKSFRFVLPNIVKMILGLTNIIKKIIITKTLTIVI